MKTFLKTIEDRVEEAIGFTRTKLSQLRGGNTTTGMVSTFLDDIRVDYYGEPTRLIEVASISLPNPQMIHVVVWDQGMAKPVEKAIEQAKLGLATNRDGNTIRIPLPLLTKEKREEIVKLVRRLGEDGKVSIRQIRKDSKAQLDVLSKEQSMGTDEVTAVWKQAEEVFSSGIKLVDLAVASKEKDVWAS